MRHHQAEAGLSDTVVWLKMTPRNHHMIKVPVCVCVCVCAAPADSQILRFLSAAWPAQSDWFEPCGCCDQQVEAQQGVGRLHHSRCHKSLTTLAYCYLPIYLSIRLNIHLSAAAYFSTAVLS